MFQAVIGFNISEPVGSELVLNWVHSAFEQGVLEEF